MQDWNVVVEGVTNCYEVLGLTRDASPDDVRAAFRLRSHMFHPDKYENYAEPLRTQLLAEAGKEFKKLTAAYEVLREPTRRAAHDRELVAPDRGGGRAGGTTRRATASEPARRPRKATEPDVPVPPRERDPQVLVRPERLDFGIVSAGATGRQSLKIQNIGGRTLFGEVSIDRAWVTVSQRSFISSSIVIFVVLDTTGLRAGQAYSANLTIKTLNGGDEVVPISVRVAATADPQLAGVPSLIDFGDTEPGPQKVRTVSLTNSGTGTLIGAIATATRWLALSEQAFQGNTVVFEVIANTAILTPGDHEGTIRISSNGGPATISVTVRVVAPTSGEGLATRDAVRVDVPREAPTPPPTPVALAADVQRDLLRRVTRLAPETDWEREFLLAIERLIRAGRALAPGELAKVYELEARASGR